MKKLIVMFLCAVLLIGSYLPFISKVEAATMSDVPKTHWAYTAANWAIDNGVLTLQTGKKFNPNNAITEADLVKMFAKLDRNYPYSMNTDMIYNYYGNLNIPLDGNSSKVKRSQSVTREQFAKIYAAMFSMDLSGVQAVRYLYIKEITTGSNNKKTYESFNPSKKLTRGEAASFLYRMAKKTRLAVEGLESKASGKDNAKITIPTNFVENMGPDVDLGTGDSNGSNAISPNYGVVSKEVQSVKVENNALIANGLDSTLVTIKIKDSFGATIPNKTSLQFQVSSKLNLSNIVATENDDYFGKVRFSNLPNGAATGAIYSDGGEISFYVTAPKLTKSYKDTIYLELINNNEKRFGSFKNKRIEIPIQYTPQAELRVSYQIYDATVSEYVGDNNVEIDKNQPYPDSLDQGPLTINAINPDEKLIKVAGTNRDVPYEGATISLGGSSYKISEYLFEQILDDVFEDYTEVNLNLYKGINGEMGLDIPYHLIPSTHTNIVQDAPETLAIVSYLVSLLPSSFNDFSMAYYDSVMAVQAIYNTIPQAVINSSGNSKLSAIKNSMAALVELAEKAKQDEIDAEKEKQTSHTKIAVSLVAPGGQLITNYRGNVQIEYNGVKQVVPFTSNTTSNLTGTGHAGAAVFVYDGLIYGDSDVKVTLLNDGLDTRYKKLLASLYDNPQTTTIFADMPIDDRDFYADSEVGIVVDLSNSMNKVDPYNFVGTKVKELIKRMDAEPTVTVSFNEKATFIKKGTAQQVLDYGPSLYSAGQRSGGTSMLEAIQVAIKNYESIGDRSRQRNMIIVTDGNIQSGHLTQMINLGKQNDIKIHVVTLGKKSETNQASMKRLATNTGGTLYHANSYKTLSSALQGVYDAVVLNYTEDGNACTGTIIEGSTVTIKNGQLYLESSVNPNCSTASVEKVKAKFYSVGGELQLELFAIGHNQFELVYDINKIKNFDLYEEVEFAAYNSSGEVIGTKKVKVQ